MNGPLENWRLDSNNATGNRCKLFNLVGAVAVSGVQGVVEQLTLVADNPDAAGQQCEDINDFVRAVRLLRALSGRPLDSNRKTPPMC